MTQSNKQRDRAENGAESTPGAAGHPEPGSGHDDSKTETVAEGPPRRIVHGEPGAFGDGAADRNLVGNLPPEAASES